MVNLGFQTKFAQLSSLCSWYYLTFCILKLWTSWEVDFKFCLLVISTTIKLVMLVCIDMYVLLCIDIPLKSPTFHCPLLASSSFTTTHCSLWFLSPNVWSLALFTTIQALVCCRKILKTCQIPHPILPVHSYLSFERYWEKKYHKV